MASHDREISQAITRIALAGDGVVLGLGLAVIAVRTWFKFHSHSKALQSIQHTPVSHIADLRSLLPPPQEYGGDSGNQTHDPAQAQPLVIVRGKVQPTTSVESSGKNEGEGVLMTHNSGDKAVIFEKTQTVNFV